MLSCLLGAPAVAISVDAPAELAGVDGDNSVLSARSACSNATLVEIHHLVVAEISLYSVGSFTHCSFAGTLALVVHSVTVGNRALRSFLTPSSCCPACPLVDSHLYLSGVLVCPGYCTTGRSTGRGWVGNAASSLALHLALGPEVRSIGLASCTCN